MVILKKQAENANKAYMTLLDSNPAKETESIEKKLKEFEKKEKDNETLIKQAKNLQDEYMRLSDRYNELEKKSALREVNEVKKDK